MRLRVYVRVLGNAHNHRYQFLHAELAVPSAEERGAEAPFSTFRAEGHRLLGERGSHRLSVCQVNSAAAGRQPPVGTARDRDRR